MESKNFIFPLLLLVALPFALFAEDKAEQKAGSGMYLATDPEGATVYIDGIERGRTPLTIQQIPAGTHQLVIKKDGWKERSTSFISEDGKQLSLYLELKRISGFITVMARAAPSDPLAAGFNPQVLFDNEKRSPGTFELTEGFHEITVKAFGFSPVQRSVYVADGSTQLLEVVLERAPFTIDSATLSRPRFNPANPGLLGSTTIHFMVTGPGMGTISVRDSGGNLVHQESTDPFTDWAQDAVWNGRADDGTALADGIYQVDIEGSGERSGETAHRTLKLTIDSSIEIRPTSLDTLSSGLIFVPGAWTAPRGSWQVGIEAITGYPPGANRYFNRAPVSLSASFAPMDDWEVAVYGAERSDLPRDGSNEESGTAVFSAGASVKKSTATKGSSGTLRAALSLRYAFAETDWVSPTGTEGGFEIALPLEWRPAGTGLSLLASPGALLGDAETASLGIGIALRMKTLTTGLSARALVPLGGTSDDVRILGGGELRWFPPPSTLVFSLSGGVWQYGREEGAFAGCGVGILY